MTEMMREARQSFCCNPQMYGDGHADGCGNAISRREPCPVCNHVHASDDARAIGRFTASPTYVAATAPTPERQTRAEAEADECRWRAAGRAAA